MICPECGKQNNLPVMQSYDEPQLEGVIKARYRTCPSCGKVIRTYEISSGTYDRLEGKKCSARKLSVSAGQLEMELREFLREVAKLT